MFPTTQKGIFKHLAEKHFMRLNNKVMTGQNRGVVSLCPLEPWGWSFSLFRSPDGNSFRQDNLFTVFKLLWKSFLIGPLGGKQPSTAATYVTRDSQLPHVKIKRVEL